MKRIALLILALTIVWTLAACSDADSQIKGTTAENKETTASTTTTSPITTDTTDVQDTSSPAKMVLSDFTERVNSSDKSAEDMANDLISNENIPFAGAAMAVEPGFLNGFSAEITGFSEGATFGPMIGSIPFVGYIFKLDDGADTDSFVKSLKDNHDLRWNICTQADEMICEAFGNTVFFVMAPASFDE